MVPSHLGLFHEKRHLEGHWFCSRNIWNHFILYGKFYNWINYFPSRFGDDGIANMKILV